MNKIQLIGVSKEYIVNNKPNLVLKNINLTFLEGKKYAILGPSGSGKSSLLNIISGLDNVYTGDVYYNGLNIKELKENHELNFRNHVVSYIKQNSIFFDNLSVLDNFEITHLIDENKINYKLKNPNLKNKKLNQYSGGQRQILYSKMKINEDSLVVIADEPTGSLDFNNADKFMEELALTSKGKILIFVTHNKLLAEKYADEILEIKNGKIKRNRVTSKPKDELTVPLDKLRISAKNVHKFSTKLLKSQPKMNSLFIDAITNGLLISSIILAMTSGVKDLFNSAFKVPNQYLTIEALNKSNKKPLSIEDVSFLESDFKNLSIKYEYDTSDIDAVLINDEEIIFDYSSLGKTSYFIEKDLNDKQIVLGLNDNDYISLSETLFIDTYLEDYLKENTINMEFAISSIIIDLEIVDVITYDNEYPSYSIFHPNKNFTFDLFHNLNLEYKTVIENSTEEFDTFYKEQDYLYVDKNSNIYKYENVIKKYENFNAINIYEADTLISYYNGIYYLNSPYIQYNNNLIDSVVYLEFTKPKLKKGRYIESINEINISTSLQKYVGIKNGDYIFITYNGLAFPIKVVGIYESDQYSIKLAPLYINVLNEETNNNKYNRIIGYTVFTSYDKYKDEYTEMQKSLENYEINSPIVEINKTITNMTNIIEYSIYGVTIILLLISLFDIVILSLLEIQNYEKQFSQLKQMGFHHKEISKLLYAQNIKRSIKAIIRTLFLTLIMSYVLNLLMTNFFEVEVELFAINIKVILLVCVSSLILGFSSFIFINKKVKTIKAS